MLVVVFLLLMRLEYKEALHITEPYENVGLLLVLPLESGKPSMLWGLMISDPNLASVVYIGQCLLSSYGMRTL